MKKLLTALLAAAPLLASGSPVAWNVDASRSQVGFAVKHLFNSTVVGEFTKYSGAARLDDAHPARGSVEVTIDVNSLDTRIADRDGHLRSPDFLDAARYPRITFKSTRVARAGKNALNVTGDLTLHGVTKPVTVTVTTSPEVKGMFGEKRRAFTGRARIGPEEFGLAWTRLFQASAADGDAVTIQLDLVLVKDAPKTAAK